MTSASSYFGQDTRNANVYIDGLLDGLHPVTIPELSILANTPQLILSLCYLVYNGLFTRIRAEIEWASYSTRHAPLRVTHSKGEQKSTYRLQLPYRWSVPLLIVSILLHWLFSNCFYVTLYEGKSWIPDLSHRTFNYEECKADTMPTVQDTRQHILTQVVCTGGYSFPPKAYLSRF